MSTVPVADIALGTRNEEHIRQGIQQDYDSREWREYRMDRPRRGRAVIANFYSFKDPKTPVRKGSEKDVERLKETFGGKLKFDVVTWDLSEVDNVQFLEKVREEAEMEDHAHGDCFVMIIMTHGTARGVLGAYEGSFQLDQVIAFFKGDKCRSLQGKPKIFIVQACRGGEGQPAMYVSKSSSSKPVTKMITLPTFSDFLIAQAQYEGFYSVRNEVMGSYFIQCLSDVLEADQRKPDGEKDDLLRLLTFVSHMVAKFEFMEYVKNSEKKDGGAKTDQASGDTGEEAAEREEIPSESDDALGMDAKPFVPTSKPPKPKFKANKLIKQQPTIVSTLLQLLFLRSKDVGQKMDC